MFRLPQLAILMGIRGSIATQTMTNLTQEQINKINDVVKEIINDENLIKHKMEFIKQLTNIIRGEYGDNSVAESEFSIAVWRATVYLLYHCDYNYSCSLCGASEYETSTGSTKAFDRQYASCPNCKQAITQNHKIVQILKSSKGYFIADGGGHKISKYWHDKVSLEKCIISPIKTIIGNKKIDDPDVILSDPIQRTKWYSVWVWNYFRQILNENNIQTHNKYQTEISGEANTIALRLLLNELQRNKYRYYFDESTTKNDKFEIFTNIWNTDIKFTSFIISMLNEYKNYGIDIRVTDYSIKIIPTTSDIPIIQASISAEEQVLSLSLNGFNSHSDDDCGWSDIIEFNSGVVKYEQGIDQLITDDLMDTIRDRLPGEVCQQMFDIYIQYGKIWDAFSDQYGDKIATPKNIAKFLDINADEVEENRLIIADVCEEMGLNNGY